MLAAMLLTITLDAGASQCFADLLKAGGYGMRDQERAAFLIVRDDGSTGCMMWPKSNGYQSEHWDGPIPARAYAIAHTHPRAKPLPSVHDVDEARRLSIPIYVVTPSGVTSTHQSIR